MALSEPEQAPKMRYLWRTSLALDNRRLVAFLGAEPRTPLPQALATTMASLAAPRTTTTRGADRASTGV